MSTVSWGTKTGLHQAMSVSTATPAESIWGESVSLDLVSSSLR